MSSDRFTIGSTAQSALTARVQTFLSWLKQKALDGLRVRLNVISFSHVLVILYLRIIKRAFVTKSRVLRNDILLVIRRWNRLNSILIYYVFVCNVSQPADWYIFKTTDCLFLSWIRCSRSRRVLSPCYHWTMNIDVVTCKCICLCSWQGSNVLSSSQSAASVRFTLTETEMSSPSNTWRPAGA